MTRFVDGEVLLDGIGLLWIQQAVVTLLLRRGGDGSEPLEVGARGVVEAHGRLPRRHFAHRLRDLDYGIGS